MYISANILESCLREHVAFSHILPDAEMNLNYLEWYTPKSTELQTSCVYICTKEEMPSPEETVANTTFLCCCEEELFDGNAYTRINLIITEGIAFKALLNETQVVFKKYQMLEERFEQLVANKVSLQEIVDIATDIVEMPLCLLDLNHNVLALSSKLNSPDDRLWDAMLTGYGYANYDIVERSEPKLIKMLRPETASVELVNNIGGHYIKVTTIFRQNRAIAFLGMHRLYDYKKPFEKHTIELFNYVLSKITQHMQQYQEVKIGRGLMYEQFLEDVLDGKITDKKRIDEQAQHFGLPRRGNYQASIITFQDEIVRTDYHFSMMNYLEMILPNSRCAMIDSQIFMIWTMEKQKYLDENTNAKLSRYLKENKCFCLMSPGFSGISQLTGIFALLKDVLTFVDKKEEKYIHNCYEYWSTYCMKLLVENIPVDTMQYPPLQRLIDYDEEFKKDYVDTLRAYLRNNCNIAKTAAMLHFHRNTLLYQINRIQELLESDLTVWKIREQLLFALEYYDYTKKQRPQDSNTM